MKIRQRSWEQEMDADPAVLDVVRRLEKPPYEPFDEPPPPTDAEFEAAGEKGFSALYDPWAARCDAAWRAVEPLNMPEANEIVRERYLARQPWATSLTTRMRDFERRHTGDGRRGLRLQLLEDALRQCSEDGNGQCGRCLLR
jgi:hypothetical protein